MKSKARLVTTLVTGGVLAAGALAVAAPAIAGAGPFGGPAAAVTGNGPGSGGLGNGQGAGPGDGSCASPSATAPVGTLSEQQAQTLAALAEEEKLAGDLYQVFADRYPTAVVFKRIATAEDQHLQALRTLMTRYAVTDPTAGKAAGLFADATVQASYDRLLAQGSAGLSSALDVGEQVERADIADLEEALDGADAADVTQAYQNLLAASRQHLVAFTTWVS